MGDSKKLSDVYVMVNLKEARNIGCSYVAQYNLK